MSPNVDVEDLKFNRKIIFCGRELKAEELASQIAAGENHQPKKEWRLMLNSAIITLKKQIVVKAIRRKRKLR